MVLVLKVLYNTVADYYNSAGSDPRTADLLFVNNTGHLYGLIIFYLLLIYQILPRFMENRKPYNIKRIIQIYNVLQIVMNTYIFAGIVKTFCFHPKYNWSCMPYDKSDWSPETMAIRHYTYMYQLNKILDCLDTVFFVLRKKYNQVSFLHVYHHSIMVYSGYSYHNSIFGSHFTHLGAVNSFVHVLMYVYYLAASLDLKINLNQWKPRMTEIQILQFFYITVKNGTALLNNWCGLPWFWLYWLTFQTMIITTMFSHFYWKTYIVKKKDIKIKNK